MPDVVVSRSAWRTIVDELDRVAPREGVLLPLVALEARTPHPCTPIRLAAVEALVLAEAHCVPPHLQQQSTVHVEALPTSDAWADDIVAASLRRSPRLRAAAYLHSHPFAFHRTSPSHGDIDGHMRPLLARNTDAGLEASFSFIACTSWRGSWHLPCFAMDPRERVIELGSSLVVPDDDPRIVRALAPRRSRALVRRWRRHLHRRGFVVSVDDLFGGWTRARVALTAGLVLVVLFPLDLPAASPRYDLVDTRAQTAQSLSLEFSPEAIEVLTLAALAHLEAA